MYELEQINKRALENPERFVRECSEEFEAVLRLTAEEIVKNKKNSRLVLLAGPSGSTKTTTAMKICDELRGLGHNAYSVSLDDYLLDVHPDNTPRLPDGNYDFESPKCLDMSLIQEHFMNIAYYKEVHVPKFDFHSQCRLPDVREVIRPTPDMIVVFEGLHALNNDIAGTHPEAYKLFVHADPDITLGGQTVVSGDDLRFVRRVIRDSKFRGRDFRSTYEKRASVRRGEQLYILPYTHRASRKLDAFQPCELGVYRDHFLELMHAADMEESCCTLLHTACQAAQSIEERFVPADSALREFLGGGSYHY